MPRGRLRKPADAEVDAVIVGSGPNGLAAAVTLAQAGWSVRVYEANDTIGGGARSAELTLPGFVHDICSAVHPLAIGSPYLRTLPLHRHGLEWIHPELALAHPLDGGYASLLDRSMQDTVASFEHERDAATHQRVFGYLADHWDALADDVLNPLRVPRHPIVLGRFGLRAIRSADGVAKSMYRSEAARALFGGMAAHSMLRLDRSPSAAFGLLLGVAGHAVGWPFPRGGAQRISDALAALLTEHGGEIITGHRIERFDQLPPASAYLFNVTPRQLLRIAREHLPQRYCRALERYRYGPGVFKIDWALSEPIPWSAEPCRRAGVVHVGGTLNEMVEAERIMFEGGHADRPFVLLAQQSVFDDSRAPAGKHAGWAYCHVPHGSVVDMTERVERQVERFAPGFRDTILARATINSVQLEQHNPNCIGGDINGGLPSLGQVFTRPVARLTPYSTPNPRIFLCSSSTPPGGGVHGMCGHNAAMAVLVRAHDDHAPLKPRP